MFPLLVVHELAPGTIVALPRVHERVALFRLVLKVETLLNIYLQLFLAMCELALVPVVALTKLFPVLAKLGLVLVSRRASQGVHGRVGISGDVHVVPLGRGGQVDRKLKRFPLIRLSTCGLMRANRPLLI